MNALTRWNPFKTTALEPMMTLDDLLRGFGSRSLWRDATNAPDLRIDVSENDGAFVVEAEMPGVGKDDIEVSVEGNQVSIGAEVKRETKKKRNGDKEIYTERYYGKVYRSFSLPSDLDSGKAEARYDSGVLTLTLPKKKNGSSRKVAVS